MAAHTKAKRRAPLMETDTEDALRRRGAELLGLVLIVVAALAGTMIWTYSPDDPSLFSATDAPPRNALGLIGASIADPLRRALGWAAYGCRSARRLGRPGWSTARRRAPRGQPLQRPRRSRCARRRLRRDSMCRWRAGPMTTASAD